MRPDETPRHTSGDGLFSSSVDPAETRDTPFSSIVSLFSCLSFGVHYIGGLAKPTHGLSFILRHAAPRVQDAQIVHGRRLTGIGGLAKPAHDLSIVPPDLLERLHGSPADIPISIAEYSNQRRHGFACRRPHLPESRDGGP